MQSDRSKKMNAQNLQISVQCSRQCEFLVQDGNDHVDAHRDPGLSVYCVRRGAEGLFDA